MEEALKEQLTAKAKWIRLLYMLLFLLVNYVVRMVIAALALFQFIAVLFVNKPNKRLLTFGQDLSVFSYHILRFLTYNTEEKPFPFCDWPGSMAETPDKPAKPKPAKPKPKADK